MEQHILIVDDDDAIREAMQEYIGMADFRTASAASAEEALHYLETHPDVDVAITDILMTGMNGLELTDEICRRFKTDVIVMTGYSADYSYEEAIRRGASDIVFKPVRFEELLLRLKRVLRERKLTMERESMMERLEELAITDGLTHLYNSRYFYSQLDREIDRSNRYRHPLSLLLLDIDHFKHYNDTFGHLEGDKVLLRMGKIIRDSLRTMDSGFRYGGEEFIVLLPETDLKDALVVADRIQSELATAPFSPDPGLPARFVTASIGISQYLPHEDPKRFIGRADAAMYRSKKDGRNRISLEDLAGTPSEHRDTCSNTTELNTRT